MKREDMKAAAKFTARCARCGRAQPSGATTAHTAGQWMRLHEQAHRNEDREER